MKHRIIGAALAVAFPLVAGCTPWQPNVAHAPGSDQPGWTGRTKVVGNNSTVASDADATYLQQKWGVGRQR
jgi:hypothetical protein